MNEEFNTPSPASSRPGRTPCWTQDDNDPHYMPDDNSSSSEEESKAESQSDEIVSKRSFFDWRRKPYYVDTPDTSSSPVPLNFEEAKKEIKKSHKFLYTLRNAGGNVYKCCLHNNCQHKLKILACGSVYECNEHTGILGSPPSIGIHPRFKALVDTQLLAGSKPNKILASISATCPEPLHHLLPTRQQIASRRIYVMRPEVRVDSVNALKAILQKKAVCPKITPIIAFIILYFYSFRGNKLSIIFCQLSCSIPTHKIQ